MNNMENLDDFINYCDEMDIAQEANEVAVRNNNTSVAVQGGNSNNNGGSGLDRKKALAIGGAAAAVGLGTAIAGYIAICRIAAKEMKDSKYIKNVDKIYKPKLKEAEEKIRSGRKSKNWSLAISGCQDAVKVKQAMIKDLESVKSQYKNKASNPKAFSDKCDLAIASFKEDIEIYQEKINKFKVSGSAAKESFFDIINGDIAMEKLTAAERKALPDNAFGLPELRKYPLVVKNDQGELDWTHLRNAIAYFSTCKDEEQRKELAGNIAKVIKKYKVDIEIKENNPIRKYAKFAPAKKKEEN